MPQNERKMLQATNFVSLCCFLSLSKPFPLTLISISDNVCIFNAFVKFIYKNTPTVYPLSCQQNHWENLKTVLSSNPSRPQRLGYIVCHSSQWFLHYSFGAITWEPLSLSTFTLPLPLYLSWEMAEELRVLKTCGGLKFESQHPHQVAHSCL